jgi:hypothetical protein
MDLGSRYLGPLTNLVSQIMGYPLLSTVNQTQQGQLNVAQPSGQEQLSTSNNQHVSVPAGQSYAYASPAFAGQGNTGFAVQGTVLVNHC